MSWESRKRIAEETVAICERGAWTTPSGQEVGFSKPLRYSKRNTRLYGADEVLPDLTPDPDLKTRITVVNNDSLDAARHLRNPCVLNFASAKSMGGGFLRGTNAQEECIARRTALYPSLQQCPEYYEAHRKLRGGLYSHRMIYSPTVAVFRDFHGRLYEKDEYWEVAILTSPAPNITALFGTPPARHAQADPVMRERIDRILHVMAANGHEDIVLGAFGCGVFGNNPVDVAAHFHDALHGKFKGMFRYVVFAVLDPHQGLRITAFEKIFNCKADPPTLEAPALH